MADSEDFCCIAMRGASRRHWPKVPEAEQPDALIEYSAEDPCWVLLFRPYDRGSGMMINYCPWCGAELAGFKP